MHDDVSPASKLGRPAGSKSRSRPKHWIEDDVELEAAYVLARDKLVRHYSDRSKHHLLMPMLSPQIIDKILTGRTPRRDQKERLVWLMNEGASSAIYQGMCTMIGQHPDERHGIIEDLAGEYLYFRHHSLAQDSYGQGHVKIFRDRNGDPSFYHWSENYKRFDEDENERRREHAGYVFRSKEKLYFLGRRKGVVRLSIATTPDENSQPFLGLTLSVRSAYHGMAFAARFALVRESDTDLIKSLSDRKNGENYFKSFFGGEKQWYMS